MNALFFEKGRIQYRQVMTPEPGPGEALVRVLVAGICNTDLELLAGYYEFSGIAGHEFSGQVEKAPDAPQWEGQRVVAQINQGCGHCHACLSGDPRHCPDRRALGIKGADGAFADYVKVPVSNLLAVPDEVANEKAVFAEPLAAALEISQQLPLTTQTRLAVLGDGKLGLLCAMALKHICPELVLVGRNQGKLAIARNLEIETHMAQGPASPKKFARDLGLFDVVVEATGSPSGMEAALEMVRPRGTIAVKTTSRKPVPLDLSRVVINEITLVGSRCGNMAQAIQFLDRGLVDPTPLLTRSFPMNHFEKAFSEAKKPESLKILLYP